MNTVGTLGITYGLQPIIIFDWETLERAKYLVDTHPIECQWWHCLRRGIVVNDKGTGQVQYFITDMFIPEQFCSGTEVESDPQMIANFWKEYGQEKELSMPNLGKLMASATVWCHSHHKMAASPSGTDDKTWAEQKTLALQNGSMAPQGMLIFNKQNQVFSRIYDPELKIEFTNVPVIIDMPFDFTDLDNIIKKNLKIKPTTQNTGNDYQEHRGRHINPDSATFPGLGGFERHHSSSPDNNHTGGVTPSSEEKDKKKRTSQDQAHWPWQEM